VDGVRQRIKALADRGVLQGWSESAERRGRTSYRFRWLLGAEFNLVADPAKGELVVRNLLPAIRHRSFIDSDLRRFVAALSDSALPAHRRVDGARVSLTYANRKQHVSLIMRIGPGDDSYAAEVLFRLLNDLFSYLQLNHYDYLVANFGLPDE
jgi:hypothetical protein